VPHSSLSPTTGSPGTPPAGFRRVLALLDADGYVAHVAAELALEHRACLSIVQTWSPAIVLFGLDWPGVLAGSPTRESAIRGLAADADSRLRALVGDLPYPGPIEFRCRRGRVSAVALDAARSGDYDAIVAPQTPALSLLARSGAFGRECFMHFVPRQVLADS
jgi:hypothetical protein